MPKKWDLRADICHNSKMVDVKISLRAHMCRNDKLIVVKRNLSANIHQWYVDCRKVKFIR